MHCRSAAPWSLLLALVVTTTIGCGSDASNAPSGPPSVVVETVTVVPREVHRTIAAVGTLRSPEASELAFELSGKIVFLDVPEGERVEAGRVLARIDDSRARATLQIAEARYENAKREAKRARSLRGADIISEQSIDVALTEMAAAEGALADARAVLEKTELRAPFDGVLGLEQVSLGAYVDEGDPIVALTQTDPLDLVFGVTQTELPRLALGQKVRGAAVDCSQIFRGEITAIEPDVQPSSRGIRLQARIPNPDGLLAPGMGARLRLEVDTVPDAIVVPQEALVREGTRHLVYVVEDGAAERHPVSLGEFFPDGVEIRSGLKAGDVIVVGGQQKIRPGATLATKTYEPTENPNLMLGMPEGARRCEL